MFEAGSPDGSWRTLQEEVETEARARAALGATASGDLLFMGRTEYVVRAMDVATGSERWNVTYAKLEMLHGAGDGTSAPQLLGQVRPMSILSLASLAFCWPQVLLKNNCLIKFRASGSKLTHTHTALARYYFSFLLALCA